MLAKPVMESVIISRKFYFACGENSQHSSHGTGYNWNLEVFISGPISEKTGLVINLIDLDVVVKAFVEEIDHKHLNKELEYFKSRETSAENLAEYGYKALVDDVEGLHPKICLNKVVARKGSNLWGSYGQKRPSKSPKGISRL